MSDQLSRERTEQSLLTRAPFVFEDGERVSLHFEMESVQSMMDVREPDRLLLNYTETMMGFLLLQEAPRTIGMVGLGGGSLAKYCHRYLPRTRMFVAEISPEVIELRDTFRVPPDSQRFDVFQEDGAAFVRRHQNSFDVLLVDAFDLLGQPEHLCSCEFYEDCVRALTFDGILVVNLCPAGSRQALTRLERAFARSAAFVPVLDGTNQIAFVTKQPIVTDPKRLRRVAKGLELLHPLDLQSIAARMVECIPRSWSLLGPSSRVAAPCSSAARQGISR